MNKVYIFFTLLLFLSIFSAASYAMKIYGKIDVKSPAVISIKTVTTQAEQLRLKLSSNGEYASEDIELLPDIYMVTIGPVTEMVYLDGNDIQINGYIDPNNIKNCRLEFSGLDANAKFQVLSNRFKKGQGALGALTTIMEDKKTDAGMVSALAYLIKPNAYEATKVVLDHLQGAPGSSTKIWLQQVSDSLFQYRLGVPAYDFSVTGSKGNTVKLSDYKGKYVLVDFWASWCGPCRAEMKKLKPIYEKHKHKNVVFVSVSMDDTKKDWEKGMEHEQIPWVNLWDSQGFNASLLKKELGFKSIPFIMLIDPQGNMIARNIRGQQIEEALMKIN